MLNNRAIPVIYLSAPKYVTWSAEIEALHYFCHTLTELGFKSWIAIHGPASVDKWVINSCLNSPVLKRAFLDKHRLVKASTISIYPESVDANPINAWVTVK
jgi:hypothetical protein